MSCCLAVYFYDNNLNNNKNNCIFLSLLKDI